MCGGGGAGGSGTQKYEWNDAMKGPWADTISLANTLRQQPYQKNPNQRIADLDRLQTGALNGIEHFATQPYGASQSANEHIQSTLKDDYLTGDKANSYAETRNAYSGNSPYFDQMRKSALNDVTDAYKQGTAADTTRMFNLSGAFGGSAHQNAVANNEGGLAKQLSQMDTGMLNDQYNRSAALEDTHLNRGSAAFEGERGRQVGSLGAGQNDQNLTLQRLNALMGAGDVNRSFNQDKLTQNFTDWNDQQNHGYKMADWYTGMLARAQGGMSPNMTSTQSGYSANPYSQILGAGLLGYSALNGGK